MSYTGGHHSFDHCMGYITSPLTVYIFDIYYILSASQIAVIFHPPSGRKTNKNIKVAIPEINLSLSIFMCSHFDRANVHQRLHKFYTAQSIDDGVIVL